MLVSCENCGTQFNKHPKEIKKTKHNFCSRSCAAQFNNRLHPKRTPQGKCAVCKALIPSQKKYCSISCKQKAGYLKCGVCKAAISSRKKYCSISCKQKATYQRKSPERRYKNKDGIVYTTEWRQKLKLRAIEYKGGACLVCGYSKSVRALHFHHLDPSQKDFNISAFKKAWNKLTSELDKCVLLCSNCHAEVHDDLIDLHEYLKTEAGIEPAYSDLQSGA